MKNIEQRTDIFSTRFHSIFSRISYFLWNRKTMRVSNHPLQNWFINTRTLHCLVYITTARSPNQRVQVSLLRYKTPPTFTRNFRIQSCINPFQQPSSFGTVFELVRRCYRFYHFWVVISVNFFLPNRVCKPRKNVVASFRGWDFRSFFGI